MSSRLKKIFKFLLDIDQEDFLKVVFLSVSFFLVIGAYTVARELKDAVFTQIIGQDRKYLAYAKILSMLVLVPTLFFHSRLVDILRKHYLLYIYATAYALIGLLFAFLLGNPTIGLANTPSPDRMLGWLFYFFIEGYSPLIVSVFWAFANSITKPEDASSNYTFMIAGSKIGGMLTAGSACLFLQTGWFNDVVNHQILLAVSSIILLFVPLIIYRLITKVPKKNLHGYEAAYKVEKERAAQQKEASSFTSMLSGLLMLFKYPYVMGIFGMSFFFELVNQAVKVESIVFGKEATTTMSGFTQFLFWQALLVHLVGFFVVVFGTRALIQTLGERRSLMLIPTLTGLSIVGFILRKTYINAVIAFVVTRSVNYAFAVPLRESLYIPTVKEIQFKTKSWIDGIGNKFAKMCASSFNMYTSGLAAQVLLAVQGSFFSVTLVTWFITAYLLGRRFEKAVARNEVIGSQEPFYLK